MQHMRADTHVAWEHLGVQCQHLLIPHELKECSTGTSSFVSDNKRRFFNVSLPSLKIILQQQTPSEEAEAQETTVYMPVFMQKPSDSCSKAVQRRKKMVLLFASKSGLGKWFCCIIVHVHWCQSSLQIYQLIWILMMAVVVVQVWHFH